MAPTVSWPPKTGVGWHHQSEIGFRIEARAHVRREIDGDLADLELARSRYAGSGRHAGVIIDRCERPSRLLRTTLSGLDTCSGASPAARTTSKPSVCGQNAFAFDRQNIKELTPALHC